MTEFMPLLFRALSGCVAGLALGVMFFCGLWLTTQRLVTSSHPALLVLLSLVGRMSVLVLGMLLVAQFGTTALIAAMCGILAVRQLVIHQTRVESAEVS